MRICGLRMGILRAALLGVEQDGDFAFQFDGDGDVGSFVVVKVADGDGEAALKLDRVLEVLPVRQLLD
jgi:hypothetical protein